jgi:hypothetical protein
MRYIVDDLKLLALVAGSGLIVFIFWLALEKGNEIAEMGKPEPEEIVQSYPVQPDQIPDLRQTLKSLAEERTALPPKPVPRQQTGDVYKWVDEKGTVSFSDRPINPEAERISVQPAPSYSFPQSTQTYRLQTTPRQVESTSQNRTTNVQTVSSTWNTQTERVARGTFMTAGGHRITASASHFGPWLTFEGRVSGGESCQSLEMIGYLKNNAGRKVRLRAVAENVGGPSRIFKSSPWKVSDLKCGWELFRVDSVCTGN